MGDLELLLTKCKQGRPCLQSHALKSQCGLRLPSIARYIPLFGHTKTQHTPGQPSKTKCGCPSDGDLKTVPYAVYLLKNGCTTVKKKKKKKRKANCFFYTESMVTVISGQNKRGTHFRAQELCESRSGRPELPFPNGPYSLCGRKATFSEEHRKRRRIQSVLTTLPYHLVLHKTFVDKAKRQYMELWLQFDISISAHYQSRKAITESFRIVLFFLDLKSINIRFN